MMILSAHKGRSIVTMINFNPIDLKEYLLRQFKTAKTEKVTKKLVSEILGITHCGGTYTKTYQVLSGSETTIYFEAHEIDVPSDSCGECGCTEFLCGHNKRG